MRLILEHFGTVIKESFLEEGREYFIGRQKDCDFVLEDSSGISRKHVKIYQAEQGESWHVESLSEWGGLYLEGEEIQSAELKQNCTLKLKNYSLKVILEEEAIEEKQLEEIKEPVVDNFQEEELSFAGKTKFEKLDHLIYSLHIFIEGEFSDHVSLSLGDSWVLGRSEDCDICIDYSFLTRKHIQFLKKESKFYIKDLGGANKTLLNGKELAPDQECLLSPEDEISVADLKILFEVRNTQHEKLIKNLPSSIPKASASHQAMVFPKVVLEDSPPEEINSSSSAFFNKKRKMMLILIVLPLFLLGGYFEYQKEQEKKRIIREAIKKEKLEQQKLEAVYKKALEHVGKQNYQFCVEQLEELHRMTSEGFFKRSQELLVECQQGVAYLEKKKREEEAARLEREAKLKAQQLAEKCQKDFEENKIKTEEDLNICASEVLSLDYNNEIIASLRNIIQERETLKRMEAEKRENYRKFIQSKKALYNRAKKLKDQKKPLKAVIAYNVFLKSAKGIKALKTLYDQAEQERDKIQKEYDDTLNALYESCENLIKSEKMKQAYKDCKGILNFKNHDKRAIASMEKARTTLEKEIKPLYEQSLWHESFARIDEAMKIWGEILEKDIKNGYYYKKADFQIKKYK